MRTVPFLILSRFLLLLAMASTAQNLSAQVTGKNPDQVYGFDPLLYNGMVYYFIAPPHTTGTQFLFDSFDEKASLTLRGLTYTNLKLNLDVLNQQLILKFTNSIGSPTMIQVSFAWLEKFEIHNKHFVVVATADTTKEIYQVLGAGPSKILYYHSRKLMVENLTESSDRFFSRIQKQMYVYEAGVKVKYKNNRTFVSAFIPAQHDAIRKYIRKHNLMVQKATNQQMNELINFCNTLSRS